LPRERTLTNKQNRTSHRPAAFSDRMLKGLKDARRLLARALVASVLAATGTHGLPRLKAIFAT